MNWLEQHRTFIIKIKQTSNEFQISQSDKRNRKLADFLNVVNSIHPKVIFFIRTFNIVEFNVIVNSFFSERNCLVDLDSLWKFAIRLQVSRLIRRVLENDIRTGILNNENKMLDIGMYKIVKNIQNHRK